MDTWLKTLIAGACVVVIAGGAYYAWREYEHAAIAEAWSRLNAQCETLISDLKAVYGRGYRMTDEQVALYTHCLDNRIFTEDEAYRRIGIRRD